MSQTPNTAVAVIGIDIGKNSFHVVGHDARGAVVLRQKWSRGQVEARLANSTRSRSMGSSFDHRGRSNLVETDDGARKIPNTSCCGTESSGPRVRCRQARAPAR